MTKPETTIKNYVTEAMRNIVHNSGVTVSGTGAYERTTVVIPSGYGDIVVTMRPHSAFTKSWYCVEHPTLGKWRGMLNSLSQRNGEYGVRVGKPKKML